MDYILEAFVTSALCQIELQLLIFSEKNHPKNTMISIDYGY